MESNSTQVFGLRPRFLLIGIALLTVVVHFAFGTYFWTRGANNAPKTSFRLTGEEFFASFPTWNSEKELDQAAYNRAALEALRTGVPRSNSGVFFDHAPFYAYFLAASYKVGGVRYLSATLPKAVLNGFICLLIAGIAQAMAQNAKTIALLVGAFLVLSNVPLATEAGYIHPVTLVLFLFSLALFAATRYGTVGGQVIFVVAIALGVWTQAIFFLVGLAAAAWLFLRFMAERKATHLVACAVVLLSAGSKFGLSMWEAAHIDHDPLRQATRAVIWEANNPLYESMKPWSLWERRPGNVWGTWKMTEADQKRHDDYVQRAGGDLSRAARLWIRENPGSYATLCCVRLRANLGPYTGVMSPPNRLISLIRWLFIFPVGFYALWQFRRHPVAQFGFLVTLALMLFETFIMASWQPTYRLPMDMILAAFAATAYAHWFHGWMSRRASASKRA